MENRIINIIEWFNKYDNSEIKIVSKNKEFAIKLNINALPHLLGLQYAYKNPTNARGKNILRQIEKENYSDSDILKNIEINNPDRLDSVKDRVKYFKAFMENLEQSNVVEMTNPKTRLKSNYLMIQIDDNTVMQLGIKNLDYEDVFETFIIEKDNLYFKDTTINEKVISIEKYNEDGELEPFSFKENSDIEKENEYEAMQTDDENSISFVKESFEPYNYIGFIKENNNNLLLDDEFVR
ncbi:hypothetical protein FL857_03325 [Criibacterium bergeronii]|uniref:Phage-Barnase-EndoU-ColicinE5/D-RelE like nuclease 4 domain-containing protein n=1 Tax=Criibacterium bergeronii TaxID=1871336 RepID=A0A552VC28_9FIRM|nr:PBECR4 domain-containing protein [Criibacterium bergeronii]TRW28035.1 hypothetical protein FL857_03325 [Criibacterium bergeronii]